MTKQEKYRKAYEAGREAKLTGKGLRSNPYRSTPYRCKIDGVIFNADMNYYDYWREGYKSIHT